MRRDLTSSASLTSFASKRPIIAFRKTMSTLMWNSCTRTLKYRNCCTVLCSSRRLTILSSAKGFITAEKAKKLVSDIYSFMRLILEITDNKKIISRALQIIDDTCALHYALWRWNRSQYNREDALRQLIVDLQPVDLCVQLYLMHRGTVL